MLPTTGGVLPGVVAHVNVGLEGGVILDRDAGEKGAGGIGVECVDVF